MPSISSCLVCDGVTETVVPGHTWTSPCRDKCSTAVSEPAVTDDPAAMRLPAKTTEPEAPVTGTISGADVMARTRSDGGWNGDFSPGPAFTSSGGFRRTIRRLPALSQL